MFKIEMLPAGHGDSLLITYGQGVSLHYLLIDGGPYYFYANKSKSQLGRRQTLSHQLGELARNNAELELMVVTHIDADHIEALVKWIGSQPKTLPIKDIWFNGRQHLEPGWLGAPEGEFLGKLIKEHTLPWNACFLGNPIVCQTDKIVEQLLGGGMKITILSPTIQELAALETEWDKVLEREALDTDDPQAILKRLAQNKRLHPEPKDIGWLGEAVDVDRLADEKFEEDTTIPNGSSIAFLAEYEGKRALFTGDAHPTTLINGIQQLLKSRKLSRLALDAFKIPHHGSKHNLNPELLQLMECRRYLISTNGSYFHHPDEQAIARILKYGADEFSRNSFDKAELCFNYHQSRVVRLDNPELQWDDPELQYRYGYKTVYPLKSGDPLVIDL